MKDTRLRLSENFQLRLDFNGCQKRIDTITIKDGTHAYYELYDLVGKWIYNMYENKPCMYDANKKEIVFCRDDEQLKEQWKRRNKNNGTKKSS